MNDDDLRDLFAFGALVGQVMNRGYAEPSIAYELADEMIKAKYAIHEPQEGIIAIKPKRRRTTNVPSTGDTERSD